PHAPAPPCPPPRSKEKEEGPPPGGGPPTAGNPPPNPNTATARSPPAAVRDQKRGHRCSRGVGASSSMVTRRNRSERRPATPVAAVGVGGATIRLSRNWA